MDLCSETFAAAYESRTTFDDRRGNAVSWLFGIARHRLAMWRRRQAIHARAMRRLGTLDGLDAYPTGQMGDHLASRNLEATGTSWESGAAWGALQHLSAPLRGAIELRVIDGLPYSEVATRLGCSEGAARVRVMRGLRSLDTLLSTR